ncbi:MAG TPA: hypothetical protein VIF57_11910 [Polyangia bacterium]
MLRGTRHRHAALAAAAVIVAFFGALIGAACSSNNDGASHPDAAAGSGSSGGNAGDVGSAGSGGGAGTTGAAGTVGSGGGGTGGSAVGTGGAAGRGGSSGGNGGGAAGTAGSGGAGGRGGGAAGAGGGQAGRGGSGQAGRGGSGGGGGSAGSGGATTSPPTIFFLDVGGKVLTAADAENPTVKTLVASAGQGPDGIAIDQAGGHLFWTDMGVPADNDGSVMRSDLDGKNVMTIVPKGMTYTPKQLRIDTAGGKLYWSDREGMKIQRSNLDGSGLETLVTTGTTDTDRADLSRWCVGMALDLEGGWFYWTQKGPDNGGVGSLRRAHIQMPAGQSSTNRSDIEVLFSGLSESIDLELDLDAGLIYWADRGDDTISRAPIEIPAGSTAANRKDRQILVRMVREAISVAIDKPRGRMYYTGGNGQLGRANLDGTADMELTGVGTLTGIVVVHLP